MAKISWPQSILNITIIKCADKMKLAALLHFDVLKVKDFGEKDYQKRVSSWKFSKEKH